jgi:hypothetical protein
MVSNRLILGALAVACISAAGMGGYFAARQNATSVAAAPGSDLDRLNQPVQESEVVVDSPAPQSQSAGESAAPKPAAPTAAPAPKRAEPSRRPSTTTAARPTTARNEPPLPTLDRSWPSTTSAPPAAPAPASSTSESSTSDPNTVSIDQHTVEAPRAPEPPQKVLDEVVVSASSVIGLETETRVSSETARVEDRVEAKVSRDVKVGDVIAIPAGSRALGSVTVVERGGKFKDRARLGIRFTTLVLADGTRMSMNTETIYRDGDGPGNASAAKIGGGAVGGAILGAILGGAKGAAIGATAGAGGGAAAVQLGDRSEVVIPAGSPMTVRLTNPLTVTVER